MSSLLGLNYYDDDEDEEQQSEKHNNKTKPIKASSGKESFISKKYHDCNNHLFL